MLWKQLIPLCIVVVVYLCIGAAVFQLMEEANERQNRQDLTKYINEFQDNHSCVSTEKLIDLLEKVQTDIRFSVRHLNNKTFSSKWDFPGSFCFAVTIVTTIGYGNLAPVTNTGRVVVVAYALIGIPLTMLMLSGIGVKLATLSARVNKLKICSSKPTVNKVLNMFLIVIIGGTLLFIGPGFVFSLVEDWTFLEALYFCFVTLSTIGFGDYIAGIYEKDLEINSTLSDLYKVLAYTWILFGLAYIALLIKYISDVLVVQGEKIENRTKKLDGEIINRLQKEIMNSTNKVLGAALPVLDGKITSLHRKSIDGIQVKNSDNGIQLISVSIIDQDDITHL